MAEVRYTCMNCGHVEVIGQPGTLGSCYGPDGYLPNDITAETCYACSPDLNQDDPLDEDDELSGLDLEDQLEILWDRANESA